MRDLRRVKQYLMDDAAVLAANALVSSCLTTATLFSEVYPVSTCANCSVFKIHLVGLSQIAIDTQGLVLFSKNSIGCQSNFSVFSKQPLWFISFFTVVTHTISALIFLFRALGMAQDTTAQIRGSWRFLNSSILYTNKKTRVKWLAECQPQSRILGQQWVLKSINLVLSPATQSEVQ